MKAVLLQREKEIKKILTLNIIVLWLKKRNTE